MASHSFAEFTTVILAGAIPTLPRLIQWRQDRLSQSIYNKSRGQYHQKPLKRSYFTQSDGSHAEMGIPGPRKYIPVEDVEEYKLEAGPLIRSTARVDRDELRQHGEDDKSVLKTVKMETSYGPSI